MKFKDNLGYDETERKEGEGGEGGKRKKVDEKPDAMILACNFNLGEAVAGGLLNPRIQKFQNSQGYTVYIFQSSVKNNIKNQTKKGGGKDRKKTTALVVSGSRDRIRIAVKFPRTRRQVQVSPGCRARLSLT